MDTQAFQNGKIYLSLKYYLMCQNILSKISFFYFREFLL